MKNYKVDFTNNTITITADFAKAMNDPTSKEYKVIAKIRKDFPEMEIIRKSHKTPTKYRAQNGEVSACNQFKNLTYEKMETFMMGLPNGEAYMSEYRLAVTYPARGCKLYPPPSGNVAFSVKSKPVTVMSYAEIEQVSSSTSSEVLLPPPPHAHSDRHIITAKINEIALFISKISFVFWGRVSPLLSFGVIPLLNTAIVDHERCSAFGTRKCLGTIISVFCSHRCSAIAYHVNPPEM